MIDVNARAGLSGQLASPATPAQAHPSLRAPGPVEDLREQPRTRSLLSGKIIYQEGLISPDCVIHNLSPSGARVRVPGLEHIPNTLGLLVIKSGLLFDATVAWRRKDAYGLSFTGCHDVRVDRDPTCRRAHTLWLELIQR